MHRFAYRSLVSNLSKCRAIRQTVNEKSALRVEFTYEEYVKNIIILSIIMEMNIDFSFRLKKKWLYFKFSIESDDLQIFLFQMQNDFGKNKIQYLYGEMFAINQM